MCSETQWRKLALDKISPGTKIKLAAARKKKERRRAETLRTMREHLKKKKKKRKKRWANDNQLRAATM